jgi:hypothetical protein
LRYWGGSGRRLDLRVTGLVNQSLLLQNEYLAAENRIPEVRRRAVCITVKV